MMQTPIHPRMTYSLNPALPFAEILFGSAR